MATLADELLNDFEESDSAGEEAPENGSLDVANTPLAGARDVQDESLDMDVDEKENSSGQSNEMLLDSIENADDAEEAKNQVERMKLGGISDVRHVTSIKSSLEPVLAKIQHYQSIPQQRRTTDTRSINDDPEYILLVEANSLYASIDTQILIVHKWLRDNYYRYPELETLITGPMEYATAVAVIGNGPLDNVKELAGRTDNVLNKSLQDALDKQTLMIVTTEATRTRGREMSASELRTVVQGCSEIFYLDDSKKKLSEFVQSRMSLFAPNLTALVGSITAAQLVNSAGGLTGLASTPNRNIPSLGTRKQFQAGLARNIGVRQRGFLYHSEVLRGISDDYMVQSQRVLSAKLVLATRMDAVHSSPDGSEGRRLRQEFLDRLDKLTGPPPNKGPKALPAPDDKPSRKRGGQRIRKMKEATAMTDIAKARNRMAFGKEEQEVGYGTGEGTTGMGMIGQDNDGRIRALKVDQRTKAKLSKKNQGWGVATPVGGTASSIRGFGQGAGNASVLRAHGLRTSSVGAQSSGTASSIAFTPVQGLELVNPEAQKELKRKREAEDDRWFKGGMFTQIGGGSTLPSNATNGGFKVPQLPAKVKATGDMGPPAAKKAG